MNSSHSFSIITIFCSALLGKKKKTLLAMLHVVHSSVSISEGKIRVTMLIFVIFANSLNAAL